MYKTILLVNEYQIRYYESSRLYKLYYKAKHITEDYDLLQCVYSLNHALN